MNRILSITITFILLTVQTTPGAEPKHTTAPWIAGSYGHLLVSDRDFSTGTGYRLGEVSPVRLAGKGFQIRVGLRFPGEKRIHHLYLAGSSAADFTYRNGFRSIDRHNDQYTEVQLGWRMQRILLRNVLPGLDLFIGPQVIADYRHRERHFSRNMTYTRNASLLSGAFLAGMKYRIYSGWIFETFIANGGGVGWLTAHHTFQGDLPRQNIGMGLTNAQISIRWTPAQKLTFQITYLRMEQAKGGGSYQELWTEDLITIGIHHTLGRWQ